jgi:hypothetical protein
VQRSRRIATARRRHAGDHGPAFRLRRLGLDSIAGRKVEAPDVIPPKAHRTSSYPRTTTLPLGSQQNASPLCDHLRCRVFRNLPAGADNRLVAGSSPPGPTTHSHANRDFPWFDEYPAVLRGAGPACSLCREEGPLQRQFGGFSLWRPKTVSPERGERRTETRFAYDRDGQRLGSHTAETNLRPRVSREFPSCPTDARLVGQTEVGNRRQAEPSLTRLMRRPRCSASRDCLMRSIPIGRTSGAILVRFGLASHRLGSGFGRRAEPVKSWR